MQAWEEFLTFLETDLGVETVQKWLRPLHVLKFDACNLYLEARDTFQAMWFEEHIRQKVLSKFVNNNKKKIKVHLSIANASPPKPKRKVLNPEPQSSHHIQKFNLSFDEIDPHCTFDTFVQTEANKLPWQLFCNICGVDSGAESIQPITLGMFNPIYVHGAPGTGKSHLLMAAAHALRAQGLKVMYVRAEMFTEHVINAIRAGEMSFFRQTYRNIDVLLLDDVQVFSRKGATQEELFHTFNTLHLAGKQIILASSCAPGELQFIEPRLISRFEWGIVLNLQPLNGNELAHLLEKKSKLLNYPLPSKVTEFLLQTFTRGTKSLTKALKALILRTHLNESSGKGGMITPSVSYTKSLLNDMVQEEQQKALTPEKIVQSVSEQCGLRREDILGKAQTKDCVLSRQIAMYLCRTDLKLPFMKIGEIFSKDHSTVMSSVRAIQKGVDETDRDINNFIEAVRKKFAEG